MRKVLFILLCCFVYLGFAGAAVRTTTTTERENSANSRNATSVSRTATTNNIVSRTATQSNVTNRTTDSQRGTVNRKTPVSVSTISRMASSTVQKNQTGNTASRTSAKTTSLSAPRDKSNLISRATTTVATNTFGTGYNSCRDAYFTCMDQFCAKQNETYRRCVCSSRLTAIQKTEEALAETQNQLSSFNDLNIYSMTKTADEVNAMISQSIGEASVTEDSSDAAKSLNGISDVLSTGKSLSTQGKLDIAGDISQIWSTTDLIAGSNILNLTGEELYNAVNSQCANLVYESCDSESTLNMVISAYGMYIENDCTLLSNALAGQVNQAQDAIRATEFAMYDARLENYNSLNSLPVDECIAQVRTDITSDTACGENYVHCLDTTGKYLNVQTGEPIYSSEFYELENQISLIGDVLQNQANLNIIKTLDSKKIFAQDTLNLCQDLSTNVWQEFVRQAITEIYQNQQNKIKDVKNDCIEVVDACYDTQSGSLKDFTDTKEQLLLGEMLELSEMFCQEKLDTCSNLYGGGPDGLDELIATMSNITEAKIAENCKPTLEEYLVDLCTLPGNDALHAYPYGCRTYAPGDMKSASTPSCNVSTTNSFVTEIVANPYDKCLLQESGAPRKIYSACKPNFYMTYNGEYNGTPTEGNSCAICQTGNICIGGTADQIYSGCSNEYEGSMYQKLVRYATNACIRPSEIASGEILPTNILADINMIMDTLKVDMAEQLIKDCDALGGLWVNTVWVDNVTKDRRNVITSNTPDGIHDNNGDTLLTTYVNQNNANLSWGYCTPAPETSITETPTNTEGSE